jgi:hypothetical protein
MFETLCFVVNFEPFHAENLEEHALDQVMTKNGSLRDLLSFGRQLNAAARNGDQAISSQSLEGSGYCRWCHGKPMGKERGDHGLAFRLSLRNGLEVVLFGNRDHYDFDRNLFLTTLYHQSPRAASTANAQTCCTWPVIASDYAVIREESAAAVRSFFSTTR